MENTRTCLWCGVDISHKRPDAKYCGKPHKKRAISARAAGRPTTKVGRICSKCQGPIPIERNLKSIYCSDQCADGTIPLAIQSKTCLTCTTNFETLYQHQTYCSSRCSRRAKKERLKSREDWATKHRTEEYARRERRRAERISAYSPKSCKTCLNPIPIERKTSLYCSVICRTGSIRQTQCKCGTIFENGYEKNQVTAIRCPECRLKGPVVYTKEETRRINLQRHGITWEEKCWLVFNHQKGLCPLCLDPLVVNNSHLDHDHNCTDSHKHRGGRGCRKCIRGALHPKCNSPVLMTIEGHPHLQNDHIKTYLAGRPFLFLDTPKNNA